MFCRGLIYRYKFERPWATIDVFYIGVETF